MSQSQNDAILAWLKAGERIDPMLALRAFGCARLAARISNLRECGYRIESTRRQQGRKWWSEYRMENDDETNRDRGVPVSDGLRLSADS